MSNPREARIARELKSFAAPPPGISCFPSSLNKIEAEIIGLHPSPFEYGRFKLLISFPPRYPFEPPHIRFVTRVFHPNVDTDGRICLDVLKMPPKGTWRPALNILAILQSIRLLLLEPNPDDPLDADIARLFKTDREEFSKKAREFTSIHAKGDDSIFGNESTEAIEKMSSDTHKSVSIDSNITSLHKPSNGDAKSAKENEALNQETDSKNILKRTFSSFQNSSNE